ncbi:hypothetical protein NM208_g15745 [Fusarium decemcellulare]|uniref:Uncharacterized protein n=1 Tax=Fusarium decemcellulare TaxID=57161 RepID=A0ACC1RDE7_9HYPO|nr:hypothetical protein NM208_g15745 [Fusarium decemcellulare]
MKVIVDNNERSIAQKHINHQLPSYAQHHHSVDMTDVDLQCAAFLGDMMKISSNFSRALTHWLIHTYFFTVFSGAWESTTSAYERLRSRLTSALFPIVASFDIYYKRYTRHWIGDGGDWDHLREGFLDDVSAAICRYSDKVVVSEYQILPFVRLFFEKCLEELALREALNEVPIPGEDGDPDPVGRDQSCGTEMNRTGFDDDLEKGEEALMEELSEKDMMLAKRRREESMLLRNLMNMETGVLEWKIVIKGGLDRLGVDDVPEHLECFQQALSEAAEKCIKQRKIVKSLDDIPKGTQVLLGLLRPD